MDYVIALFGGSVGGLIYASMVGNWDTPRFCTGVLFAVLFNYISNHLSNFVGDR